MIDVKTIKKDFPFYQHNNNVVYLDTSATSLKPKMVIDAEVNYYSNFATNTHNEDSELAYKTVESYEGVRVKVQQLINCARPEEVVFNSGATFGANQIAFGIAHLLKPGDIILLNKIEHASNLLPWYEVAKQTGAQIEFLPLLNNRCIDTTSLPAVLNPRVKIISFANISNTLSYVNDVQVITDIVKNYNQEILVCVDLAQGIGHIPTDVQAWDIDFAFFSAHKIFGPTGVGVMYGKYSRLEELKPLLFGGSMNARVNDDGLTYSLSSIPARFEAGTPNIAGVFGLGAAIDYLLGIGFNAIHKHESHLKRYFLEQANLRLGDKIEIYNADNDSGTIVFNMRNVFAQDVATHLGAKYNVVLRAGDHCAKLLKTVLCAPAVLRASFYIYNDKHDVDRLIDGLATSDDFLASVVG